MTERKRLKLEISKLKSIKKSLPRLIDCSEAYGDNYFNDDTLKKVDEEIDKIEEKIRQIDLLKANVG